MIDLLDYLPLQVAKGTTFCPRLSIEESMVRQDKEDCKFMHLYNQSKNLMTTRPLMEVTSGPMLYTQLLW